MKTLKQNGGICTLIQYDFTKSCLWHVQPSSATLMGELELPGPAGPVPEHLQMLVHVHTATKRLKNTELAGLSFPEDPG